MAPWRVKGALACLFLVSSALLYLGSAAAFLFLEAKTMAFVFSGPAAVLMIMGINEQRSAKATIQQPAGPSA